MGVQRTGGFIGRRAVPSSASASGIWHISEAEAATRDLLWPLPAIASPASLSGLQLWLDGSDGATLYDATTGGSVVAADAAVARWEDKSGNGRHFTQATSSVQPLRKTSVKNGLGAVEFTNDWLGGTHTYTVGSVFVVWNHPTTVSGDSNPAIVGSRTSSATKVGNSTLAYVLTFPSSLNVAVDPRPSSATYRLNGSAAGVNFTSFNVGVAVSTSPDRWQYTSASFSPVSGSKAIALGADSFSTVRFMQNGHIGELLAYSSQLTETQVLAVETYLVKKWGL